MIDAARQRTNMVESQVLTSDVTDKRILRAMGDLPRERFVPPAFDTLAYMDEAVPLTSPEPGKLRRWLAAPRTLAKLLQLAEISEADRVLDVGAASGYSAAVLAGMARSVVALESDPKLADAMRQTLTALSIGNVSIAEGELTEGWSAEAPYDAIVVEGAIVDRPQSLLDQLKDGGRLVAIVVSGGMGKATIWRRLGRSYDRWNEFDAPAHLLPGFEPAPVFAL
jgi:protein-L-isoaspartate(D-aspartate) O-methyltransferase